MNKHNNNRNFRGNRIILSRTVFGCMILRMRFGQMRNLFQGECRKLQRHPTTHICGRSKTNPLILYKLLKRHHFSKWRCFILFVVMRYAQLHIVFFFFSQIKIPYIRKARCRTESPCIILRCPSINGSRKFVVPFSGVFLLVDQFLVSQP